MATNNTVNFTINLNGNAYNGVVQLSNAVNQTLNPAIRESESLFVFIVQKYDYFKTKKGI